MTDLRRDIAENEKLLKYHIQTHVKDTGKFFAGSDDVAKASKMQDLARGVIVAGK